MNQGDEIVSLTSNLTSDEPNSDIAIPYDKKI